MMKTTRRVVTTLAVLAASVAFAQQTRVHQFRSVEDPKVTADPTVCAGAPFQVNLRLAASLWSTISWPFNGKVINDDVIKIGEATACGQITDFTFPPGLQQKFYVRFDLPDGSYTASGTCTLVSNDVPQAGVVLAGCNLKVISAPGDVIGGMAVSASVLNPFRLENFNTGSYWTLLVYEPGRRGRAAHAPGGFERVTDTRSATEIQEAGR